jgi:hypothetical protein
VALYDSIGRTYAARRRTDPRIAAAITGALGAAGSVVNVGAGTGSYEPASTIAAIEPSSVTHDCVDGFGAAYWRRPEAYLDPDTRAGISFFARATEDELRPGLDRLAGDLRTGRWHAAHADLLERDSLDVGYCLLIVDL